MKVILNGKFGAAWQLIQTDAASWRSLAQALDHTPSPTEVRMRIIAILAIASTLLLSACTSSPQRQESAQSSAATASSSSAHHYHCESGEAIAATYPSTDSATVQYKGGSYNMQRGVSGSGARYVGNDLEWWTKALTLDLKARSSTTMLMARAATASRFA